MGQTIPGRYFISRPIAFREMAPLAEGGAQGPLAVVAMASRGFLIAWNAVGTDGDRASYSRLFGASGLVGGP